MLDLFPLNPLQLVEMTRGPGPLKVLRQLRGVHLPADPAGDHTGQATSEADTRGIDLKDRGRGKKKTQG